jgi:transposase
MIPAGVEVFVATTPVDLRYGFDRLSGIVTETLQQNARSGALFVFVGKRGTSVKVLFADRTGICLFYKRLDRGTFRLPDAMTPDATHVVVTERALDDLLEGIAIEAPRMRTRRVH